MAYLLALDQGTTSSRALVFDEAGRIHACARQEFTQHFPQPGWVEHDADEIWSSQLACARQALHEARLDAREIVALGIANQRETVVLWERASGRPVAPAIVWQDRRTAGMCARLKAAGHEALVRERTGLVLDPYFSGTKLAWLLDTLPGLRARAERGELAFGTVDSWLCWKLTAGRLHVTDVSNASRTLLYNIHTSQWDEELLALLGIPRVMLPEVRRSSCAFGESEPDLLGAAVMIGGIAGDQQAALFGQGCRQRGLSKNTYGTGCFALTHTGQAAHASNHGLVTTRAAQVDEVPAYALEGSVFVAGALIQWLRDGLGIIDSAAGVEALARQVTDAGGVYIVPAFTGLGAPYWQPEARGAIVGLSRGTTRAHIAFAALEAIAFQSAELLEAMQADGEQPLAELRVDGGACANDLLMQMQADLLGIPVLRPAVLETTAWGAACLAGLSAGVWSDPAELDLAWKCQRHFEPAMSRDAAKARLAGWRRAVQRVF